jgi:uncharacterized membrane protein
VLRRFWRRLIETIRADFIAGLLVFVPVGFTILGVLWIIDQLDRLVLPPFFRALGMEATQPPIIGALVTLCVILLAGALARSVVGRAALLVWERLVRRIPVARSLYSVLKQFMETVFGSGISGPGFSRVVLIQYPRQGLYSYAFVTGRVDKSPEDPDRPMLKIFVPSTPNPTTGYFLLVPEVDTIQTGLTVDEAFRLIISAGIATREAEAITAQAGGEPVAP